MTRKSKRELERAVDGLPGGESGPESPLLVWEDPATGAWYDAREDGERVDRDECDPVAVIEREREDGGR